MSSKLIQSLQELVDRNPKSYAKMIKGLPELFSFVNEYPGEKVSEKCFNALNNIKDNTRYCGCCKGVIDKPFINITKGYKPYCSIKCSVSTPEALAKKQATNLAKYGVDNPAKAKSVQEKAKQTNLEKYGVEYVNQVKVFQEKSVQTNLEKYGTRVGSQSDQVKDKMRETNQAKYGVDYILQSEEFKDIQRKNNLEKYGVEHTFQVREFQDKSKSTIQNVYGVDNVMQAESVQEKAKQTNLERYGFEYSSQNLDIRESIKQVFMEKYGVDHPMKTVIVREKMEATNIERYGVSNIMELEEYQEKVKQTSIERYGFEYPAQNPEVKKAIGVKNRTNHVLSGALQSQIISVSKTHLVTPLFSSQDYIEDKPLQWKHVCGVEYSSNFISSGILVCPNPECRKQSTPQRAVYEYVRDLIGEENILVNDRKTISPYELDIYIHSKGIAIEMDGVYWHQDEKESLDKASLCGKQNIQLLHITDLSWYEHTEVWKSIIASKLKTQTKIFARKCELKIIDNKVCSNFLDVNHLQGSVYGSVNMGLYHSGELVAVMNFGKPRFNNEYQWELLRYSSKLNVTVVGGASKLLNYFKDGYSGAIVTYAKKEYSNGGLYKTLGFELIDEGKKSYFYIHRSTNMVVSRYQAQKHRLPDLIGDEFDIGLTEKENMAKAGYFLVNDRGSFTFGLN
jgi:hypothetical protein